MLCLWGVVTGAMRLQAEPPGNLPGWTLVWHDEFDGEQLDPAKWRVEHAALVKNNEAQFYARDEVYLENAHLVLRSRQRSMGGRPYTSGLVETKGKFSQQYGRFEIRAKLPGGQGIWPAHWMLPASGSWPPEIDIMELVGHERHTVHMTNHFGVWPQNRLEGDSFTGPDFTEDFHTYALEWEPGNLRWYVDGTLRHQTRQNVPDEPFFIILNTAVGGDWPGYPDETTEFPQFHIIDYVRVWAPDMTGFHYLTLQGDRGKVMAQPEQPRYAEGSPITVTAFPAIGFLFDRWSGDATGRANPLKVTMDRNRSIRAHFTKDPRSPKILSQGSPVKTSSAEKPSLEGSNAVDGDPRSRWSSEFSDPQWIAVDLGKTERIQAVRLNWETAHGQEYLLETSQNGRDWKTVVHEKNGKGDVEEFSGLNVNARYVRMTGLKRATRWGYSLYELEIFG